MSAKKMAYPMKALVRLHVDTTEYATGAVFDALTIGNVNYLKKTKSAEVILDTSIQPAAVAKAPAPVAETKAEPAKRADTEKPMEKPAADAGAKGKPNAGNTGSGPG